MARDQLVDPMATVDAVTQAALGVTIQADVDATAGTLERYRDTDEARNEAPVVTGSTADGTALLALIRALRDRGLIVDATDTVEDEVALDSVVTDALDAKAVRVTGLMQVDITDAVTTLAATITSTATSITVADGTAITAETFIRIDDEPIYVSSISGNTLTVVRSPTKSAAHTSGADVWVDKFFVVNNGANPNYFAVNPSTTTVTNELIVYKATANLDGTGNMFWQVLDENANDMVRVLRVTTAPAVKEFQLKYGTSLGVWSSSDESVAKFYVAGSSGDTATAGTLSVTGDVAVNTNKFNVTASSGDTATAGTLTVGSTTDLNGDVTVDSTSATALQVRTSSGGTTMLRVDIATAGSRSLQLWNGTDLRLYSDGGTTEKARILADNGNINTVGTLNVDGAVTLNGAVTVGSASTAGALVTNGANVSLTAGGALGTSPTVNLTINSVTVGNNMAGHLNLTSGTSPTTGTVVTVTFANSLSRTANRYSVQLTPLNTNAAANAPQFYVSARNATTFVISCVVAPAASTAYHLQYAIVDF